LLCGAPGTKGADFEKFKVCVFLFRSRNRCSGGGSDNRSRSSNRKTSALFHIGKSLAIRPCKCICPPQSPSLFGFAPRSSFNPPPFFTRLRRTFDPAGNKGERMFIKVGPPCSVGLRVLKVQTLNFSKSAIFYSGAVIAAPVAARITGAAVRIERRAPCSTSENPWRLGRANKFARHNRQAFSASLPLF